MDASFYIASGGAGQQQRRLNIYANNIANINTYGFKAEHPSFTRLVYGTLQGVNDQNLPQGVGTRMISSDIDFSDGSAHYTGGKYDFCIGGNGFFGIFDPVTQETFYTRRGAFSLSDFQRPNAQGELETVKILSDGFGGFVLDTNGNPLEVDPEANLNGFQLPIAVYTFDNTNGMRVNGDGRFVPVMKNGAPRLLQNPRLQHSFLEASNSDATHELTKIIEAQRSYSYALKMVQTADEVEQVYTNLRK